MTRDTLKIGIIGGGNMGAAILGGIHKKFSVCVCEKDAKRGDSLKKQYKVKVQNLATVVAQSEILILAVKPQDFDAILEEVRSHQIDDQLIISIAAGITTKYIEKRLFPKSRVIRVMPNLPAQVGEGMTGICHGQCVKRQDLMVACQIFNSIGKSIVVKEKWMDAITAISGSGPAYVFLFIECLEKAARSFGLKEDLAQQLVAQTFKGSIKLLESQELDVAQLRQRVTSKGGTTAAALDVFQKKQMDQIVQEALKAAARRAKELAK